MTKADDTPGARPPPPGSAKESDVNAESAADRERRQASELLAGFDRPGRGPRRSVRGSQDFVDYYASGKKAPGEARVEPTPDVSDLPPMRSEAPTFVLHRERERRMPAWLGWATAALVLVVVGGGVAYLATMDDGAAVKPVTSAAPSAATTITSGASAPPAVPSGREDIPPPVPEEPGPVATVPSGAVAVKRAPVASASASVKASAPPAASASSPPQPPPRDDLIREMH